MNSNITSRQIRLISLLCNLVRQSVPYDISNWTSEQASEFVDRMSHDPRLSDSVRDSLL